jgi:Protein of unknown function (DUF1573)
MSSHPARTSASHLPTNFIKAWIPRVVGSVLLIAAGLKVYGFNVDPVARTGMFSAPAFQFLVIVFELGLGGWLLSGQQRAGAWIAAMLTFTAFAGVSCYQGVIGQASCGCLGSKVSVNPWLMFVFDIAAIAMLLISRPDLKSLWTERAPIVRSVAGIFGAYVLLMGILAGVAHLGFGSIDAALASIRNERLSVFPALIDMGEGVPGETREAKVELTNRTDQPIRLIGGSADCSCTVLADLPVTIPPGESRSITVAVRLPNAPGTFNRKAGLQLDDQGFRKIDFRLTGRISKASS